MDIPPPDALCERCWGPLRPGQRYARFGHVIGSTMRGDVTWAFTWLHFFDPAERSCEIAAPRSA